MEYTIDILRSAQKQLSKIEHQEQERIIDAIRKLAQAPRPQGSKNFQGDRLGGFGLAPIV